MNVLQKVHHPHCVQFFGAVTKQKPFMIITEFMGCGSMADMFRGGETPSLRRAVQLALDCARGIAYLHNHNPLSIIHRCARLTWYGLINLIMDFANLLPYDCKCWARGDCVSAQPQPPQHHSQVRPFAWTLQIFSRTTCRCWLCKGDCISAHNLNPLSIIYTVHRFE
jgi:hypothetical protein